MTPIDQPATESGDTEALLVNGPAPIPPNSEGQGIWLTAQPVWVAYDPEVDSDGGEPEGIVIKKHPGHLIDLAVCTLGRHDGGNEQLERGLMFQLGIDNRIPCR